MPSLKDLKLWIGTDPAFKIEGKSSIFCQLCEKPVEAESKFLFEQHKKTKKHKEKILEYRKNNSNPVRKSTAPAFANVTEPNSETKPFKEDLCAALLKSEIPLSVVDNKIFKSFLSKYTGQQVPSSSALRECNVSASNEKTIEHSENDS